MSLSRDLVRLVRDKPVSEEDLRQAALFVLDTLACALGALQTEPARILGAVAPPGDFEMTRQAFYLGGLSHILELDDLHRNSVTHPGCVVIPAAWAIADGHDLRGRAFLRAVLAGYEAATRVGMAVGDAHYRVWHNTSTCGPFGSAMAAAELLDLTEDQAVWALGNAGTQSCGLWEFLSSGAMSKHLHTARAAESGVLAARLAQQGFTGSDTILEGEKGFFKGLCPNPSAQAVTAAPDAPWQLTRSSIKPWPCCRHTHPAIDAAIALHGELDGAEVVQAEVATYRAALDVCDRPDPGDPYSARFSLQHCVAAALRDGCVEQHSFGDDGRRRAAGLRPRIALRVSPELEAAYPAAWGAEVRIRTRDDRVFGVLRPLCKGDPENPVTRAELTEKAASLCASGGIEAASAQALFRAVDGLVDDLPVRRLSLLDYARPGARERPAARQA
jgi:2-methylcitrate dehydratase PrpD